MINLSFINIFLYFEIFLFKYKLIKNYYLYQHMIHTKKNMIY